MSTKTKLRLIYRPPSFPEGISRVFDVLGILKDDISVHVYHHHRGSGLDNQSGSVIVSPENVGTKAINSAFQRIHKNMGAVAGKMRPSIPTRNHKSIFK